MPAFIVVSDGPGRGTIHLINAEGKPYCGQRKLGEEIVDSTLLMTVGRCQKCRVDSRRADAEDSWSGKA